MLTSEAIGQIAAALAKAQGKIRGAIKDSANPHFRSKYADLASVWEACREQLAANDISVIQGPGECADGRVSLSTILAHKSGEWFRSDLTIPLAKVDAQAYGSAVTYARRYALAAMVGVAPEDDDGNAAVSGGNGNGAVNDAPRRTATKPRTDTVADEGEQWAGWVDKAIAEFKTLDADALDAWREANARYTAKLGKSYPDLSEKLWEAYNSAGDEQTLRGERGFAPAANLMAAG